jgi:Zn-dependent protease/CBS domain-containing protein
MFGHKFPLFRILGFQVYADMTWIFLAVLITWSLASGLFPTLYPGLEPTMYWSMGIVGAIGLFASLILHELSHSLVARRYGLPIGGITLWIFGGVAEMTSEPETAKAEFRIAIAGPLMSFALAGVFYLLAGAARSVEASVPITGVLSYLALINLILAIFNLIPAFPLDGGRVLRAGLWAWKGNLQKATRWASFAGSTFGMFLIAMGLVALVSGNFLGGFWWMLIGFFVHSAARSSYSQLMARRVLEGEKVERFMSREVATVPPDIDLRHFVEEYVYAFHHDFYPVVNRDGQLVACLNIRQVKEVPREEWDKRRVIDVADHCTPENTIRPDADAGRLLQQMTRSGHSRLMVVDKDKLVGVVVLKDLMEYISMRLDLEGDAI